MTASNWITIAICCLSIATQLLVVAYGYGKLSASVSALTKIVTNGLSDKVHRMDTRIAVIATRMGIEEDE